MKIAFIGGGNMGEAMLASVTGHKLANARDITVSEPLEARRQYLEKTYSVMATSDSRQAVKEVDVVVLSVKPQVLPDVLATLKGAIKPSQLVLSIIAGATITTISKGLEHKAVIRSMPNTPAQIGEGITGWTATPEVTAAQKEMAKKILGAMGQEVYVDNENYIDMVTAVSGSGPAYVFLFIEAFEEAAKQVGLPPEAAQKLVKQTVLGSTHLLNKSGKQPAELREAVTSKGGTTAAALAKFEEGGFKPLFVQAVKAAYERAKSWEVEDS